MGSPRRYAASAVASKLGFNDPVHNAEYIGRSFVTDDGKPYDLEARILYNAEHEAPWVLVIHGARADYTKANPAAIGLQERVISSLSVTLSGHSAASPLAPDETSLGRNIAEAEAFFEDLDPGRQVVIIGFSLGSTPALKLLERHADRIAKIVLFYPGIYAAAAYDQHYGPGFSAVLRRPHSWRGTDTMELLRTFTGKVMLVKGEYDGLDPVAYGKLAGASAGEIEIDGKKRYSPIPAEVIAMVKAAAGPEHLTYIEVPGCDHSVLLWMRDHPEESRVLLDQLAEFILTQ